MSPTILQLLISFVAAAAAAGAFWVAYRRPLTDKRIEIAASILALCHQAVSLLEAQDKSRYPLDLAMLVRRNRTWLPLSPSPEKLISEFKLIEETAAPFFSAEKIVPAKGIMWALEDFGRQYQEACELHSKSESVKRDSVRKLQANALLKQSEENALRKELFEKVVSTVDSEAQRLGPNGTAPVRRQLEELHKALGIKRAREAKSARSIAGMAVEIGAMIAALGAAVFWGLSAYGDLPGPVAYYDSTPSLDPFYAALAFSARMNQCGAALSCASAICIGISLFLRSVSVTVRMAWSR